MVAPAHLVALSKEGAEIFILTSTKMAANHMFIFSQSCGNLGLKVVQILKQANIHTE